VKKLVVLYKTPADPQDFLDHYRSKHLPLVQKVPGLVRTEISMITRTLLGEQGNFMLAEMYFEDDSFRDAMRSRENADTGSDLSLFAEGLVTVMTADVIDD
jgi:uncharacterized protein (TIGR02118 family)